MKWNGEKYPLNTIISLRIQQEGYCSLLLLFLIVNTPQKMQWGTKNIETNDSKSAKCQ